MDNNLQSIGKNVIKSLTKHDDIINYAAEKSVKSVIEDRSKLSSSSVLEMRIEDIDRSKKVSK